MGAGLDRSSGALECCGRLLAFVVFLVCACLVMAMVATDGGASLASSSSSTNAATSAMATGGSPAWRSSGRGRTVGADAFRSSDRRIPKGPDPIHNRSRGIPNTVSPELCPNGDTCVCCCIDEFLDSSLHKFWQSRRAGKTTIAPRRRD